MDPFEYLLLLAGVLLGLAVADLAISLHRLVRPTQKVKWDWLAPLAALAVLVRIVVQWWQWYGFNREASSVTFAAYLWVIVIMILLFLMAGVVLPDEAEGEEIDLKAHFERVGTYFFSLFTAHGLASMAMAGWWALTVDRQAVADANLPLAPIAAVNLAALSAVFIRRRWWRGACLAGIIAVFLVELGGRTLTG